MCDTIFGGGSLYNKFSMVKNICQETASKRMMFPSQKKVSFAAFLEGKRPQRHLHNDKMRNISESMRIKLLGKFASEQQSKIIREEQSHRSWNYFHRERQLVQLRFERARASTFLTKSLE
jgi:hypothetical protein